MWAPPALPETLRREVLELSASQKWWEARHAEGPMPDLDEPVPQGEGAVPMAVLVSTKWDRPDGWSKETYDKYMAARKELLTKMAKSFEGAEVISVDVSHHIHIDHPDIVMDAIRRVARASQE